MLSENDKAWMAGFLDGEGYITISRLSPGHRHSPYFVPVIAATNTAQNALRPFMNEYGGGLSDNGNSKHKGWSPGFVWRCPVPMIERLLSDVNPYLRLKKDQAIILSKFMKLRRGSIGGQRLPASELEQRRKLWLAIHECIHAKGKRDCLS